MNKPVQKTIPVEVSDNSCNSCLDFVSSDSTLDRYGEVIQASGWKLENYQRNPVFQNSHQYGDILFTLGKALITEVRGGQLFQRIQFACDINPMAKIAYGLYKGGFLRAVSVGFIPLRWETPGSAGVPAGNPTYTRKYLEQELLEVSAVAIPANPNALALGLKSGAIEKSDLRDLSNLLRSIESSSSSFSSSSSIPDPGINFLRELHTILKHI